MLNSSALQGREDAEEEAVACGQRRSEAEVRQKTGRLSDLHHCLIRRGEQGQQMPLRRALTGCKDLWVSHCTSQDAPVMRKPTAVEKGSSAKDYVLLLQGLTHMHGVL